MFSFKAMCNLYTHKRSVDEVRSIFARMQMPLAFPDGVPNLEPRDVAITDPGPIVRAVAGDGGGYELVVRRWSWPMANGKPLYNFRTEGRTFPSGRCLILADGFYEYTAPADPKQKRKDRWLFTAADDAPIAIAGLVREVVGIGAGVSEAFTMLTTEPGPDVAPYHGRQVAVLGADAWRGWLDDGMAAAELLRPGAAGTLVVTAADRVG